jgi:hypothetical protein
MLRMLGSHHVVVASLGWPLKDLRGSFLKYKGRLCGLAATVLFFPREPHFSVHSPNKKMDLVPLCA